LFHRVRSSRKHLLSGSLLPSLRPRPACERPPASFAGGTALALLAAAAVLFPGDAAARVAAVPVTPSTTRVSIASDGTEANGASDTVAVSSDGRFVAFSSSASNLVRGDTNGASDVFLRDRVLGTTVRVSVARDGSEANGASSDPSVSADGRFVVFSSTASNLVSGDTNGVMDVFVRDLDPQAPTTARVSVSTTGAQGNGASGSGRISGDGRYVAFRSDAPNFAIDTNGRSDVFLRDLAGHTTTRVSVSSTGGQNNGTSYFPAISADGRYVAFVTPGWTLLTDKNGLADVYVHDNVTGETTRASIGRFGGDPNGRSTKPSLSAEGRYVAFTSAATNLIASDANAVDDVYVRDTVAGTTARVSVTNADGEATGASDDAAISGDGRFVAFGSFAANLVAGDANGASDVFVRDRQKGTTVRTSVSSSGEQATGASQTPATTATGRYVAFRSDAANLVSGDANGVVDAFVRDLGVAALPDLALTLSDERDPVPAGGTIRLFADIANNKGAAQATNVTLRLPVPSGTNFARATPTQGSCSFDGAAVACALGTVPVDGTARVTFELTATTTGRITSTATVSERETDWNTDDNTATEVTGVGSPDLVVDIRDERDPVPQNIDLTYTVSVDNTGPVPATGVTVSNPLPRGTTFRSAKPSQGSCAFDASLALVTCSLGSLESGARATVALVVRATAEGTVVESASADEVEADRNPADNRDSESTTVTAPLPNLVVSKRDVRDPVTYPDSIAYKIGVTNSGTVTATGVTVTDRLPALTTFSSASSSKGTCAYNGTAVVCSLGSLAPSASATVTLVLAPTQGDVVITNGASATEAEDEADPSDNSAATTTKVTLVSEWPDPTYQTNGRVSAIVATPRAIYIAGRFTKVRPRGAAEGSSAEVVRNYAAAIDPRSGDLLPWNPNANGQVNALEVTGDGSTVYLGGNFTTVGGVARNHVAAVDAASATPSGWNPSVWGKVDSLQLSPDGSRIYVGGAFMTVNGVERQRLAAVYTASRNVVQDFVPSIVYPDNPSATEVDAIELSPDGKALFIGGNFQAVDGQRRLAAAKLDVATGRLITAFDAAIGRKINKEWSVVSSIVVAGDVLYLCGDFYEVGGAVSSNVVSVLAATGARRAEFKAMTDGATNGCAASDTKLYMGGHFERVKTDVADVGVPRNHIASVDLATGALSLWDPYANSVNGLYELAVTGTRVFAGGEFTKIGHWTNQQGFAQFPGLP
jgi:uncharacterized repeat protein (TIGR01451 family)